MTGQRQREEKPHEDKLQMWANWKDVIFENGEKKVRFYVSLVNLV
jgi:hypothetical protein